MCPPLGVRHPPTSLSRWTGLDDNTNMCDVIPHRQCPRHTDDPPRNNGRRDLWGVSWIRRGEVSQQREVLCADGYDHWDPLASGRESALRLKPNTLMGPLSMRSCYAVAAAGLPSTAPTHLFRVCMMAAYMSPFRSSKSILRKHSFGATERL